MSAKTKNQFEPDYAVAPGELLAEQLEDMGMSQKELAERMGKHLKTVNEIVKGKAVINAETSLQLEKVTGIKASVWNNAEALYQEAKARIQEAKELKKQTSWLKEFSLKKMVEMEWIPACDTPAEYVAVLLRFFGVASHQQWVKTSRLPAAGAFRHSAKFKSKPGDLRAWLRYGRLQADRIECQAYDEKMFRGALKKIRLVTTMKIAKAVETTRELCAASGVAYVLVPELPNTHVSGVTHWIQKSKAVIQQSARHKSDDHLWFTFFHEAGHVLLHPKKRVYLEYGGKSDEHEDQANRFARDMLIPPSDWRGFLTENEELLEAVSPRGTRINWSAVKKVAKVARDFAQEEGIAPGIVAGRLQKEERISYGCLNELKVKLKFTRT